MEKVSIVFEVRLVDGGIKPKNNRCENYFEGLPDDVRAMLEGDGCTANIVDFLDPGKYLLSITFEKIEKPA